MKSLLIHHHAAAFTDKGKIWINSNIGRWVNGLSQYFVRIGLLVHETRVKNTFQDTCINRGNVCYWNWLQ